MSTPSASNSITFRLKLKNQSGILAKATHVISDEGGDIGAIDIVRVEKDFITRDITVNTTGNEQSDKIEKKLKNTNGIEIVNISDRTFLLHLGGKIEVTSRGPIKNKR